MTLTLVRDVRFALGLTGAPRLKAPISSGIADCCDACGERVGEEPDVQVDERAAPEAPVTSSALTGLPGAGTSLMLGGSPSKLRLQFNADRLARLTWRTPLGTWLEGVVR